MMTERGCPFCSPEKVTFENELAMAIPDKYPVRPGHTQVTRTLYGCISTRRASVSP